MMERIYYSINEKDAKTAHNMMSFSDYKTGSKTEEYKPNQTVLNGYIIWQTDMQRRWQSTLTKTPALGVCVRLY
mgnify:CR=1 FL=1